MTGGSRVLCWGFVSVAVCMSVVCLSTLQNDFHGSLGPLIELGGTVHPHPFLIKLLVVMTPLSPHGWISSVAETLVWGYLSVRSVSSSSIVCDT